MKKTFALIAFLPCRVSPWRPNVRCPIPNLKKIFHISTWPSALTISQMPIWDFAVSSSMAMTPMSMRFYTLMTSRA